jgi:hypothetical protein
MPPQFVVAEHVTVHVPPPQAVPFWQTLAEAPQLLESLLRLTQVVTGPSLVNVVAGTSPPAQVAAHAPLVQI